MFSRYLAVPLLMVAAGCAEPSTSSSPVTSPGLETASPFERQSALERTARRFALAMADPAFRARVRTSLERSRFREQKIDAQPVLRGLGEEALADLDLLGSLELYLPVPSQRQAWRGTDDFLVATSMVDGDTPVAFDARGRRTVLDPATPPASPVLALLPAEIDFNAQPNQATCTPETCPTEGGGGEVPPAPHGIYLTQSYIYDLHEDWLRGSPEIEAMFMGPLTDTTQMSLIACANESAYGARYYNQDNHAWTGNVLIADSMQLERVRAAYPVGTPWKLVRFTVAFWEDDSGRCQIATTVNTWKNKLLGSGMVLLGGTVLLATDWSQPIDNAAWPFIVQLPLGLVGLVGTIGGNDDFVGLLVNSTAWNPLHPTDQVSTTQVLLDGGARNGTASIWWK